MADYAHKLRDGGLSRRQFLGVSMLGSLAIYSGSGLAALTTAREVHASTFASDLLRPVDVAYFSAVLPAVIIQAESPSATQSFLSSMERMLTPASPHTLGAIQDLVDLLTGALTRQVMTLSWTDWPDMTTEQATEVLEDWRDSSLGLKRAAYGLTTSLVRTAWYMQPGAQALSGYPGAPKKIVGAISATDSRASSANLFMKGVG